MLIQDLQFFGRAEDVLDIRGGVSADTSVSTSVYRGKGVANAYASGIGQLNTSITGTNTAAGSSLYYVYSYGTAYGAAYGASYVARPGYINSDIKSSHDSSISSNIA